MKRNLGKADANISSLERIQRDMQSAGQEAVSLNLGRLAMEFRKQRNAEAQKIGRKKR